MSSLCQVTPEKNGHRSRPAIWLGFKAEHSEHSGLDHIARRSVGLQSTSCSFSPLKL